MGAPPRGTPIDATGHHYCVAVADLDAAVDELEERGIDYQRAVQGENTVQIWISDPAGNTIELQQDTDLSDVGSGVDAAVRRSVTSAPRAIPSGLRGSEAPVKGKVTVDGLDGDDLRASDVDRVATHPRPAPGVPGTRAPGANASGALDSMRSDCAGACHSRNGGAPGASWTTRARRDRRGRVLSGVEQAGQQLQEDLRLDVAAHRSDDLSQRAVGTRGQRRGERVGRTPARAVLGGMTRLEREPDTAVVEEDPRLAGHEVGTEVEGVGLGERDAETVCVDCTQMGGVPVRQQSAGPTRGAGRPASVSVGCAWNATARSGSTDSARGPSRSRESSADTVGAVVEDRGTVEAGGATRLGDQVGPQRVGGIGGDPDACRRSRHRPA